ncbi:MAG TPA: PA domain-containing protein, partial [Actinoplanes sp.]|nr:PA domain-containing protein [Actinoplanes sp.]
MKHLLRRAAAGTVAAALIAAAGPAYAHGVDGSKLSDDGAMNSGKEVHAHDAQHGGDAGHLPATSQNVRLVGKLGIADGAGRVADVSAKGNYAYLARFYEPTCSAGGIDVVDIANPAAPRYVSTIPSHTDTFTGEGSQVVSLKTASFTGDLLVYNNEICPGTEQGIGGVTLVDVTNPLRPKKLVEGAGDITVKGQSQRHANEIHSAFAWQAGTRAYVVIVDDEEATDVDILDITNPSRPVLISETDLTAQTEQPLGAVHGDAVFLHDMIVKPINGRQIMLLSYWDGGYVKLDVTDPAKPQFLADTDFAAIDPVRAEAGQAVSPEGNAHQAEFTRDNRYFIATDEDFDPYRVTATITGGAYAGTAFTAIQGSDVPQIGLDRSLAGPTEFVGLGCAALPAGSGAGKVAVIERGECDFVVKVQNAQAAGYTGVIVFNRTGEDGCETLITMLAEADIPAVFVSRTDGFRILGRSLTGYTCNEDGTGTAVGALGPGSPVDISAVFDGWGYVHLYNANTMAEVDTYALPEGQNPAYANGFGDLSVHEVATDPDTNLAYISHYAGGFRVLKYGASGLTETGRFID